MGVGDGRLIAAITRMSFHVSSVRVCSLKISYDGLYFNFLSFYSHFVGR